jgi:hypothetical protein
LFRGVSMSTIHLRRTDPTVDAIVRAAFPGFRGQTVKASIGETIRFSNTNWDEGSKSDYVIVQLSTMNSRSIEQAPFWLGSKLHEDTHTIPDGFVVVELSQFMGKEFLRIHGPAANIAPMLPEEIRLTRDERAVLISTRSHKSSYAGHKNYRWYEANSIMGINLDRWEVAKSAMIDRNFLNKAGAITVEGRNAIGNMSLYALAEMTELESAVSLAIESSGD